jgi:uncharacterized RDD family membrane protein YckC
MICPKCQMETAPSSFCGACDIYLFDPSAGTKAGVAPRFMALLLDGIFLWILFFGILILRIVAGAAGRGSGAVLLLTTFSLTLVAYTILSIWFLCQGTSLGKWLVGIRVVDKSNGHVPGLGRMLVREIIGKFFSGLSLGLGYFWAIWDRNAQAWHDKIAGTLVVLAPATAGSRNLMEPVRSLKHVA